MGFLTAEQGTLCTTVPNDFLFVLFCLGGFLGGGGGGEIR